MLIDLNSKGVDGARVEPVLGPCGVDGVPGDRSAMMPGSLWLGTPAMMAVGFKAQDFTCVADFVEKAVQITVKLDNE